MPCNQILRVLLPKEEKRGKQLHSKRKEILCVCHDELTLQVRQMLLEHFGYKVLATNSVGKMHAMLRQM